MTTPRIGVAVSGGGFRATCFGLGCLRALHDEDLLRKVAVISGVSGGSLLTALYSYGPTSFADFDRLVVDQLRRGFQGEVLRRALRPDAAFRNVKHAARAFLSRGAAEPRPRGANRTDALRETLAARVFGDRHMTDVTHAHLATVITATDLRTTNAVRFGSQVSSCSAYGAITEPILVAEAVAASAAFPLLLPAIERRYAFTRGPGDAPEERLVQLVDGGVYDNLGLSVLEPGRSSAHTPHIYETDYVISCDAGAGRPAPGIGHFFISRMVRSFATTHRKAQDAARGRLHQAHAAGLLRGFVQVYLGTPDDRLPVPIADLIPASTVRNYPTDFRAMSDANIEALALRGEQLTRTLLGHYCPDL